MGTLQAGGLEVDGVTVRFGGVLALDGVSMTVAPGAVVGVIGPNGAGKTTLFNAICGLVRASAGRIGFEGRDLRGIRVHELLDRGIARTLQGLGLWRNLTAIENVMCGARRGSGVAAGLMALPASQRRDEALRRDAHELLAQLGIEGAANGFPPALPYGIQKRVSIARALMSHPSLLLLDEPASGLSQKEVEDLAELIRRLSGTMSVALVEHNMDFVMAVSSEVVVLNAGRVIARGSPADVRANRAVTDAYLGEEVAAGA